MVSTRSHPSDFSSPVSKPSSSSSTAMTPTSSPPSSPTTSSTTLSKPWAHTPSNLTLLWLAISLPLVIWDTAYVLLRPYSMPGGWLHAPIWTPYELYGKVDYIYGWPAYESKNGFTAGQASLNVIETVGYMVYLWIVWKKGEEVGGKGRGAPWGIGYGPWGKRAMRPRRVEGEAAGVAALLGFAIAVMTLSKTVLYCMWFELVYHEIENMVRGRGWLTTVGIVGLCEYFSGFDNIGHNSATDLIFLWIIPNGLWLALPTYMIYVFGQEILEGLEVACNDGKKKR